VYVPLTPLLLSSVFFFLTCLVCFFPLDSPVSVGPSSIFQINIGLHAWVMFFTILPSDSPLYQHRSQRLTINLCFACFRGPETFFPLCSGRPLFDPQKTCFRPPRCAKSFFWCYFYSVVGPGFFDNISVFNPWSRPLRSSLSSPRRPVFPPRMSFVVSCLLCQLSTLLFPLVL